jgi:hypothetical protein
MTKSIETTDYSVFKILSSNRSLDTTNLKRIKASLQANNLLEMCPIIVTPSMEVIDGQHRLQAAKELGIPVWYVINHTSHDEDIILLNAAKKNWTLEDYLNFYVAKNLPEYRKVLEFCEKYDLSVRQYLRSYFYEGKIVERFKAGTYKFPDPEKITALEKSIEKTKQIIEVIEKYCFARKIVSKSPHLQKALYLLVELPELDLEILCRKIAQKADIVRSCGSCGAYYQMFLDIYNYRNPKPITDTD